MNDASVSFLRAVVGVAVQVACTGFLSFKGQYRYYDIRL